MPDNTESVPEVDAATAYEEMSRNHAVILDVREQAELEQIAIAGALHIPLGDLQRRVNDVPRDRDVYVLCHVGQRSAVATEFLRTLGHERTWNVRGGIIAWLRARLPAAWGESGETGD